MYISHSSESIVSHVRNKILLREYIDLAVLLNNSNSNNTHDNQKIAFINGELIVQQEQNAPKITSIPYMYISHSSESIVSHGAIGSNDNLSRNFSS
jgi:hypothetical protein